MISEIEMCNCATYDLEGSKISTCNKVNFIYGPNGSGKSTISNFLQSQDDPLYKDSKIIWDSENRSEVMVYNKKFREQNFSGSNIAGVFTLGQATIEEISELEKLKYEKSEREKELNCSTETLKNKEAAERKCKNDFRDSVWKLILKENESQFQVAFDGLRNNKEKFRDELMRRFQLGLESQHLLNDLQVRANTLYASKPELCQTICISINDRLDEILEIESSDIWQKIIVGDCDIELGGLIEQLNNADWVNQGRSYISGEICPFCQQPTVSSDFVKQLSQYFNKEYEESLEKIDSMAKKYWNAFEFIITSFNTVLENIQSMDLSTVDADEFKTKINLYQAIIQENVAAFSQKKIEPSQKVSVKITGDFVVAIVDMISAANKIIEKNNVMVKNYKMEQQKLSNDVWIYLIDEQYTIISGYAHDLDDFNKAKNGILQKMNSLQSEIKRLSKLIIQAGKNITSVQPTVDEINRMLIAYGFQNFQIAPSLEKENYYQIQRPDGVLASNTLSEGEETFISFLYFMQLAKGSTDSSKVSAKKILVLDDPICSLDSSVLYVVSAIVKQRIQEIKQGKSDVEQIFILTHNVYFHKEISFTNGRTNVDLNVNYWIISKEITVAKILSYGKENPISTSYDLMWKELRDNMNVSFVSVQNTMRRIIENYFSMLGNTKYDYIEEKFESAEEKMICQSLFYWINDGSHSIPDDLYIDSYSNSMSKYKEVFYQVFLKTGHCAHYNMMMNVET